MLRAKVTLTAVLVTAILGISIVTLLGCQSKAAEQNAIANRLDAEAALKRAEADRALARAEAEAERNRAEVDRLQVEAEAYQRRTEAATSAEIERSAIRQAERNASHERIIETLPFLILVVGVVAIGALAVVMVAGRQSRPVARDPELTFLVQRQQQQLDALERAIYAQIARSQRRRLPEVVVCDSESLSHNGGR